MGTIWLAMLWVPLCGYSLNSGVLYMKKILFLPIICVVILFSSCTAKQELEYYSNPDNYITVVGTVTHIEYNEEMDSLYLGLQQIPSDFSDNSFKIVGKNLLIAQESGIDQRLKYGEQIEFISAPSATFPGRLVPPCPVKRKIRRSALQTVIAIMARTVEFLGAE